jgi:hypothetical protein
VSDLHRVVKEVLEKLVFACPRCLQVKRTYTEIFKHAQQCDGVTSLSSDVLMAQPVGAPVGAGGLMMQAPAIVPLQYPDLQIYIMEKDSRKFYLYNTKTQVVTLNTVQTGVNFPHNF